jgi:hypothetical protein
MANTSTQTMKPNNKKVISNLCFVNVIGKGTITSSNYVCTVDVMVAQYDTLFAIIKIVNKKQKSSLCFN